MTFQYDASSRPPAVAQPSSRRINMIYDPAPHPTPVAAGRLNRTKRRGLTADGRERLRRAAQINHPWRFSTGPRTLEGKAVAAANGKMRQLGLLSARES